VKRREKKSSDKSKRINRRGWLKNTRGKEKGGLKATGTGMMR
jgi:hypothetical protein